MVKKRLEKNVEMEDCAWVEFGIAGEKKTCPFPDCNSKTMEKFCRFCLEGQKVDALNTIAQIIYNYGEREGLLK